MDTQTLLQVAVSTSQEDAVGELKDILEYAESLKNLPPDQLTDEEKKMLPIAKAFWDHLPVVDITLAIKAGGVFPTGLPKLALAPYYLSLERGKITVEITRWGSFTYSHRDLQKMKWRIILSNNILPTSEIKGDLAGEILVPLVPPTLRQSDHGDLVILFEVGEWKHATPSRDPYLLKHLVGDYYAVLGSWNVTDLEIRAFNKARRIGR